MSASRYYTIGMAGHIDHGKTTLTKALTGVETDRLKEEKERQISIELGYAKFPLENYEVSIIDVPGHERFIRQMIAGVAGIDLVVLVIAADEGVMPQTQEHLEILSFLGIKHGVMAVTKADKAEPEFLDLVKDDIRMAVKETVFEDAPLVMVDSISGIGLPDLKKVIYDQLSQIPVRKANGAFRLPIDQVFTLQGHGTIVRGVIYEGMVEAGEQLIVLPSGQRTKVRELQVHNEQRKVAFAGQRAAINISGIIRDEINRGDVLVSPPVTFKPTTTLDVELTMVQDLQNPLKQRAPVKFHSGTAEVMGKIVYFDRNEAEQGDQIYCQIRLDEPVIVLRGDRFVIRRPSPVETLGGGWVIDPLGAQYRFGEETIQSLERKAEGSPEGRTLEALNDQLLMSKSDLLRIAGLPLSEFEELHRLTGQQIIELESDVFTSTEVTGQVSQEIHNQLARFHEAFPMRTGMNKAECLQLMEVRFPKKLTEWVLERDVENGQVVKQKQYIALSNFKPHFPQQWERRMQQALEQMEKDGLSVASLEEYLSKEQIPIDFYAEWKHYVLQNQLAYELDDQHLVHAQVFDHLVKNLYEGTNGEKFGIKEAKTLLDVSRKNLVLFLERLDQIGLTQRDNDQRKWRKEVYN